MYLMRKRFKDRKGQIPEGARYMGRIKFKGGCKIDKKAAALGAEPTPALRQSQSCMYIIHIHFELASLLTFSLGDI
jgi:hypothetical protein